MFQKRKTTHRKNPIEDLNFNEKNKASNIWKTTLLADVNVSESGDRSSLTVFQNYILLCSSFSFYYCFILLL